MAFPAISPLPAADRIAGLLLHLEHAAAPRMALTTLAVRRGGGVASFVVVHLEDGTRHSLDAGDARVMARCLRDDAGPTHQAEIWAQSLDDAAEAAERQANAILFGMGQGRGVTPARSFGAR